MKQRNLTEGNITANLIYFALPMMAGNLLQQCYNIADTLIVGRFLGFNALAAVGSSYTLMSFLTSILLGLCMGSGAVFSICFGEGDSRRLKSGMVHSFGMITAVTIVPALWFLQGCKTARNVSNPDSLLFRYQSAPGLYLVGSICFWSKGHLDLGSHRLGSGGCSGCHLL